MKKVFIMLLILLIALLFIACFNFMPSEEDIPPEPKNLTASDGNYTDKIVLEWDASAGATQYRYYVSTSQSGTYTEFGTPGTSTTINVTGADVGTTYWFKVKAENSYGLSAFSNADSGYIDDGGTTTDPPDAPANLTASDGNYTDKIVLEWDASAGATQYRYYVSTSQSGTYTEFGTPGTSTAINVTGVDMGTTYWFKVKAENSYGLSAFSNADSGYIDDGGTSYNYTLNATWYSASESDQLTSSSMKGKAPQHGVREVSLTDEIRTIDINNLVDRDLAVSEKPKITMENIENKDFDSIMVKFRDDAEIVNRDGKVNTKYEKYGLLNYRPHYPIPSLTVVKPTEKTISNNRWLEMIEYYNSLPEVEYAVPNYKYYQFAVPNDPLYDDRQWNMTQLNMPTVWDITEGSNSVTVAVIDSGMADDLDDTPANLLTGYDFADDDNDAYPPSSTYGDHGTHVAGTVAQATNNNTGVAGMAPGITIMPLKVFPDVDGGASTSDIINAIQYAIDNNADVINMSLGSRGSIGYSYSGDPFQAKCTEAFNAGIAVIAASGNSGDGYDTNGDGTPDEAYDETVGYPAGYDNVMAVGATDYNKDRTSYSQYGTGSGDSYNYGLDIVAPGGSYEDFDSDYSYELIYQETTTTGDSSGKDYLGMQGTSMASPHVAGLAALLKSVDSSLTPQQIYDTIENTADTSMSNYSVLEYGSGLINPLAAVQSVSGGGGDNYLINDSVTGEITTTGESNGNVWEISVAEGTININLVFSHSNDGDFDLKLYHSSDTTSHVAVSQSSDDNESISYNTDTGDGAGTYKIVVYEYQAKEPKKDK